MSDTLAFRNLRGQDRVRSVLTAAFAARQLAHAYLFTGPAGSGKFVAALELAMGLLCDAETGPCGTCESCRMVLANNHPDFRCVFPIAVDKSGKTGGGDLNEEGWNTVRGLLQERLDNPWGLIETPGNTNIPVDWIRELNDSIMRGPTRSTRNVAIICDVDHMQAGAANAMLKTLEEPPAGAVIILLSARPHGVLLTTRSRCQTLRFGIVDDATLAAFLSEQAGIPADDPAIAEAIAAGEGAPGRALSLLRSDADAALKTAQTFLALSTHPVPTLEAMTALDALAATIDDHESGFLERHFAACSRLLRSEVLRAAGVGPSSDAPAPGFDPRNPDTVSALFSACERGAERARSRVGTLLILVDSYLTISEIVHDTK